MAARLLPAIARALVIWPLGMLRADGDPFSPAAVAELVRQGCPIRWRAVRS